MKNSGYRYAFMMMLILGIPLNGQVQYTSAYRSGEGRVERTNQAAILVNPVFVQPSVFFSAKKIDIRTNRKWWRNTDRMLPKPYNPALLPANILRKDQVMIEKIKRDKYAAQFIQNPELSAFAFSFSTEKAPAKLLD